MKEGFEKVEVINKNGTAWGIYEVASWALRLVAYSNDISSANIGNVKLRANPEFSIDSVTLVAEGREVDLKATEREFLAGGRFFLYPSGKSKEG